MKIGVISDTHGLLRPQAIAALQGVEHILHAGDIGDPGIICELKKIAPVTAIRGNVDSALRDLPDTETVELGGKLFYLIHDVKQLDLKPEAAGFSAVISGHSHKSATSWKNGVLYFNPGAAGPRRFSLPISLGFLHLRDGKLESEIKVLEL